jgi:GTP-binding protein YchF
MIIALIGFSNSGKTTIFNALTHQKIETSPFITPPEVVHKGILYVEDSRLKKISEIVKPKKTTFATIECIDLAGFLKNNSSHNFKIIRKIFDADALVYVLRAFDKSAVAYQFESIDPLRDLKELEYELLMTDLDLITKRIERIDEQKKRGQKVNEKEREVLELFRKHLEEGKSLREISLKDEMLVEIRHLSFITMKPAFAVINMNEKGFNEDKFKEINFPKICGTLEYEISQLPEEEKAGFLNAMNIDEPVNKKIIRKVYEILNYISFFTTAHQEVRAWSIKKGTKAIDAAGKIHSDIKKGFIRAEVISYSDYMMLNGDMNLAKQKGIFRLEGKEYEIKDGDIITFRFKVYLERNS